MTTTISSQTISTPLGPLVAFAGDDGLRALLFDGDDATSAELRRHGVNVDVTRDLDHPVLRALEQQLDEYFAGRRRRFELPLDPVGTDFQLLAWSALREIPFGETRSYGEQARAIGRPTAVRAIGAANGRNPLPIVVPCHRVIGGDGALVGFGGGLPRKRALLELEGALPVGALPFAGQAT